MNFHIGKEILQKLNGIGMSKSEFARRISKSPQNVQDIFTRESVDTSLLKVISEVLEFNFFSLFTPARETKLETDIKEIKERLNGIELILKRLTRQASSKGKEKVPKRIEPKRKRNRKKNTNR